jgi:aspartate-semialdehyde dehydrogenase
MEKLNVGIIGATGMVGQRFITLLSQHPWFCIKALAASARSAGKTYAEAIGDRWVMDMPLPEEIAKLPVLDASADAEAIAQAVQVVFCAVDMPKEEIRALEEKYARLEVAVISNNSAHRGTPDVPMIIPELNADHSEVITFQKKRLHTSRGFIAVKSNCSLQSYVPALFPLSKFGIAKALACTYQAISGAGKTFERWPEMVDNIIPYIGGEEEKSENEPLKIWGRVENGVIVPAQGPNITTQCIRVPITNGHTAAVFASFDQKPDLEEILDIWKNFKGDPQIFQLPSAPKQFLHYFTENDQPQIKTCRDLEGGMAVSIGRLRPDKQFDIKFVCMSHNTLRGAAGGAVLMAELLTAQGFIER